MTIANLPGRLGLQPECTSCGPWQLTCLGAGYLGDLPRQHTLGPPHSRRTAGPASGMLLPLLRLPGHWEALGRRPAIHRALDLVDSSGRSCPLLKSWSINYWLFGMPGHCTKKSLNLPCWPLSYVSISQPHRVFGTEIQQGQTLPQRPKQTRYHQGSADKSFWEESPELGGGVGRASCETGALECAFALAQLG